MLEEGTIINDRYRVGRLLGEGGMGAVFEGEHTGVGRKVAIKVLHPAYSKNREVVERFEREARAAAAIGHDNIIDVIDFGRHGDAHVPYMIMEFLKGDSLGNRLHANGPMPAAEAAQVMGQLLSALVAAHAAGIVHRDLKPDNVYLITKGGQRDFVKLLDFGISKFADTGDSKGLTQTGALMGTPYYMSPEQALAKRDVDHRADIYSAGVMLYEMVTGRRPFTGESQAELLLAIVYQMGGVKKPTEYVPSLPLEFEAVILRAMSRERENRFQDAAEFIAALEPFGAANHTPRSSFRPPAPVGPPVPTPLGWSKSPDLEQSYAGIAPVPATTGAPESPAPRARKPAALYGGIGLVATIAIIGGFFAMRAPGAAPPATAPITRAAMIPPVEQAPSATVCVDLEGVPPGATVLLDGTAAAPPRLIVARGGAHTIRVTAAGLLPFETSVTADRDRSIVVAMQTAPAPVVVPAAVPAVEIAAAPVRPGTRRPAAARPAPAAAEPVAAPAATHPPARHGANPLQIGNEF